MKKRNGSPGRLSSPESRLGRPDVQSRLSARDRRGWGQTPTEGRGSVPDDSQADRAVHIQGACPSLAGLVEGQEILNTRARKSGGRSAGRGTRRPWERENSNKSGFCFPATRGYKMHIPMQKKSETPDRSSNDLRLQGSAAPNLPPRREQQSAIDFHSRSRTAARQPALSIVPRRTAAQTGTPRHW